MSRTRKSAGRRIDALAHWLLRFRIISAPARWIANSTLAWSVISRTDRIRRNRLRDRVKAAGPEMMPQHISMIMDGNRRFAWNRSMDTEAGHAAGKQRLKDVMRWILDLEIPYLTVYALSTENLTSREGEELDTLFDLYVSGLEEISTDPMVHENRVKVQVVGRTELLPERLRKAIAEAEAATSQYSDFLFTVCLAYGGREEIVDAVKTIAADHAAGDLDLDSIDPAAISSRLYTAELPDPDLVIRTSGEERVSNFLLWQIAYSELYFTDVHWPSFRRSDLYEAIEDYQLRRRRYGV
ncbi:MAG: di-trans,poly-cis-decaprenylcistransferase [Euryarchaeota archaeon]|jgi:tritrans,polycis-undecaprenyl-diphosphate synthase [geranylgeranyl-diphosphate specific]|nr:di-trans,poly-cis-decaprenylcistransferase [Euryarchaeota archaeon]|tara:strand:+ start:9760 stop:10650 length:891 start_codon:yes stop_codon:yes gene_type:complete